MKIVSLFWIIAFMLAGCDNKSDRLEKEVADLQSQNAQLSRDVNSRDQYVDDVTRAINHVYDNLEAARAKENFILRETQKMEAGGQITHEQVRLRVLDRIADIDSTLQDNRHVLSRLQSTVASYKTKYKGLQVIIDNLKKTVEEREHAIADLRQRVGGLEHEVRENRLALTQKDSVIGRQHARITTAYFITGTRDELEKKGIIAKEGGFLWGLLGSTTTLASGFDAKEFKPIDNTMRAAIPVEGKIRDIIPKRNEQFYSTAAGEEHRTVLTIADPDRFWQEKYLVIVTD